MTKDLKNASVAKDLAELKRLFTPPVLTSEDLKTYYTIMARFLECLKPRDFVEQIFIKDLTDSTWEIMRYSRHKTMVIEREHERHLEIQAKRRQEERKMKAAIAERVAERAKAAEQAGETKEAEPGAQAGAPTSQFERKLELEEVIDGTVSDVDEILDGCADELDHAKALQSGIAYFGQLDRLMSVQVAQRNDVLEQIEFYRQGLGRHLRDISDDIIDGEFSETKHEAPSLAGPGDGAQ
jgi:phenylpyruvate tautomerase PptA (4-oxalocrotonate tautomerase family)